MTKIKTFMHWAILFSVPQAYLWAWKRRNPFWLQIVTDPTADPTELFDELHRTPLIPIPGLVTPEFAFLTGRHDTVTESLHNPDLQTMGRSDRMPKAVAWFEKLVRPSHWDLHPLSPPGLNAIDGPLHDKLRKAVRDAFSPRRLDIEETVSRSLDQITSNTTVDLLDGFCRKFPAMAIGSIFGLFPKDVTDLDYWRVFDFALGALDVTAKWSTYRQNVDALIQLTDWVKEQISNGPADGLPHKLADNPDLDDAERIVTSMLMLEAGFITTVHMLSSGIRLLLEHPDQLATLQDNPQHWPNAVEEILRMEPSLRLIARKAARDTTLAGRTIKKGKIVIINLAAANRDPAVFADSHHFDVSRPNANKHLAFSTGRHYCLGPAMARAEGRVGLRMFFERFPDTQLVACEWEDRQVVNGLSTLVVAL